mgnify:CR=1 FL=1
MVVEARFSTAQPLGPNEARAATRLALVNTAPKADQTRRIAIFLHPARDEAIDAAVSFAKGMAERNIECVAMSKRADLLAERCPWVQVVDNVADLDLELLVVFGGDGTILRAAEVAVPKQVPLLGVNLGHVGFLAELDPSEIGRLVEQVAARDYDVESRLTLHVEARDSDENLLWASFAVNEVSIEKFTRQMMLDMMVQVDGRPLYRFGCDGLVVSTPTGSTAYAFSLHGPVVWPDVQAFLVVPMAAHALFARPLVLAPDSIVDVELVDRQDSPLVLWCDGRRTVELAPDTRVRVQTSPQQLLVARLSEQPFTSRLVKKFNLNVEGFRRGY